MSIDPRVAAQRIVERARSTHQHSSGLDALVVARALLAVPSPSTDGGDGEDNNAPAVAAPRTSAAEVALRQALKLARLYVSGDAHKLMRWESVVTPDLAIVDAALIASEPPPPSDIREALEDALSGWRYLRKYHGDLCGVGWERVEQKLVAAITSSPPGDGKLREALEGLRSLSDSMADDEGLWFQAQTCAEAYVQRALRILCDAIERAES